MNCEVEQSFEKLANDPKYQNILKTYKYDIRNIIKILELEKMGIDIGILDNKQFTKKANPLDILILFFKERPVKPVALQHVDQRSTNQTVLTKVPFAEDGVHGTDTYNDKGELVRTEFVVDTDTDTEADGCDSDSCEFDSEPEPDQIPVEPAPKTKEYLAMKLLDKKIAEAKEEEGSSNLSFTQMF